MYDQVSPFEVHALGLLAVLERLPMPLAVAFDRRAERVLGNRAFRLLTSTRTSENISLSVPDDRRPKPFRCVSGGRDINPAELPLERAARDGVEVPDFAMQLVRVDGKRFDLVASAWPLLDRNGEVAGSIGVFADVTQTRLAEERYRLIAEAIPHFIWLDDAAGTQTYANQRWCAYLGVADAAGAGLHREHAMHPNDAAALKSAYAQALADGADVEMECRYLGADGKYRWFLYRRTAIRDDAGTITGWLGTAADIDAQKRAEQQQAFSVLAGDELASSLDVSATLERIARLAVRGLGTWCQLDLPDSHGTLRPAVVAHPDPHKERLLRRMVGQAIYNPSAAIGPPGVYLRGTTELLEGIDETAVTHVIPEPSHRALYREVGYACGMIVPLIVGERVLGVLGVASDDSSRLYNEFDFSMAKDLGRRGAIALENARSFEREHQLAATLQRALLPEALPRTDAVEFFSAYVSAPSARGEAVGGDWYDAFALANGTIALSIGDVAGHGIEAAVVMSVARQAMRAAALEGHAPKEVLDRANAMLGLERRQQMVTAIFGCYDPVNRRFSYAIAGHPRPLAVDKAGRLTSLEPAGPPLGIVFDAAAITGSSIAVEPGWALVFFTDGLIEYKRDLQTAEERLARAVSSRAFLSAQNPAQAIVDSVLDGPQRDDIAVLVLLIRDEERGNAKENGL